MGGGAEGLAYGAVDPITCTSFHSHQDVSPRTSLDILATPASSSDRGTFFEEIKRLLRLAGPLALQDVLLLLQDTISVAFVGRIDRVALSSMTLANTMFNVLGLSLIMGLASGSETLSGQCFGARNYAALGVTLQRSLLITWSFCLLIIVGWTQLPKFLLATRQEAMIVEIAMKLIWLKLPSLFFISAIECLKRYLMAQGIVTPTCLAYVLTTCLAPLINYILIYGIGLGVEGSSIANNVTNLLNCTMLLGYIAYRNRLVKGTGKETWQGWSRESFRRWGEYYQLAIPATVMLCLEWWTFEMIILMTGILPDADTNLGVIGIMFQLGGITYMIPLGLQGAASTRVSNELGDGRPFAARNAVRAAMTTGTCTQLCVSTAVFLSRHQLGYLLTSDPEIVARVADVLPVMCLIVICDGTNAVASGAIRGCGRQMTAACLNLSTFWGIGVPLAAFLGFKASLGVKGFWLGVSVSAWAQVFTMLIFIGCLDWEQEALRAAALVQSNKEGDYKKLDDEENAFEVMHLKSEADS